MENPDLINQPPHYTQAAIEPIDYIRAHSMSFCEGNIIKYLTRHNHKATPMQDLLKCRFYINKLIEDLEQEYRTQ
jgi:hypothetical protein